MIDSAAVVYNLYGVPLVVVDSFKCLGVFVSSNFKWGMYIDDITSRIYQRLGMIKSQSFKQGLGQKICIFSTALTRSTTRFWLATRSKLKSCHYHCNRKIVMQWFKFGKDRYKNLIESDSVSDHFTRFAVKNHNNSAMGLNKEKSLLKETSCCISLL